MRLQKVITKIIAITLFLWAANLNTIRAEDAVKIDYVAKFNELSRPADYNENDNAAPYYQKAFELCTAPPEQLSPSDLKTWPKYLNKEKQTQLKNWVLANNDALEQLRFGSQKPCYWPEYLGDSLWSIAFPSLAQARKLTLAITSSAKLNAADGNFKTAFSDLLLCRQFKNHLMGKKPLIDQLVGMSVESLANDAAFQILDKRQPPSNLLKDFQGQLSALRANQTYAIDFTFDRLLAYDHIQRIFTDDGQGSGHIITSSSGQTQNLSEEEKMLISSMLSQLTKQQKRDWNKMEKRQTTELANRVFEYLGSAALKMPYQLHKKGKAIDKITNEMTETNPMLNLLTPAFGKAIEMSHRTRTQTDALITTIAVLRYKADKNQLPENLDRLVADGYLNNPPQDPYSAGPLTYKRTDYNFLLYSLGANFDDDGGTPDRWGQEGGDHVFWPLIHY